MNRLLMVIALLLSLTTSCAAFAADSFVPPDSSCLSLPAPPSAPSDLPSELQARRGCCSWHGGVCGCLNGRVKCCDGTLSPTCGCQAESPIQPEG